MFDWKSPIVKQPGERYIDAIKELDNIFLVFKRDLEKISKEVEEKDSRILELNGRLDGCYKSISAHKDFLASITPIQVYHNKKRKNTTVKFLDGKSVTVHRMKRDKDCLETAIVYAIYKKLYPKKLLEVLVKNVIETGEEQIEKQCEKN